MLVNNNYVDDNNINHKNKNKDKNNNNNNTEDRLPLLRWRFL